MQTNHSACVFFFSFFFLFKAEINSSLQFRTLRLWINLQRLSEPTYHVYNRYIDRCFGISTDWPWDKVTVNCIVCHGKVRAGPCHPQTPPRSRVAEDVRQEAMGDRIFRAFYGKTTAQILGTVMRRHSYLWRSLVTSIFMYACES